MTENAPTEMDVTTLGANYQMYISEIRAQWLASHRVESKDVYEAMSRENRERVHQVIAEWGRYVTPLAESWWRERGYGVVWPDDDSKPMRIYKLK